MSATRSLVVAGALGLTLTFPNPCPAQPPGDDDLQELIVLLAPEARGAPSADAVVDAVNSGNGPIPGGLGEGNPERARLAIQRRARGRLLERIVVDPDSAEARLQRYVVLTFPPQVNLDGVMTGLRHNRNVEFVEKNQRMRLHSSSALPAKASAPDPLVGTGTSAPESAQWALHLLHVPEACELIGRPRGFVGVLDTGLQVDHPDLAAVGTDAQGDPALGPIREHLSRDYVADNCGVDELEEKPFADPANDRAGHGSIVSGIIAAQPNGLGVAGICPDCSIEMMRVAPSDSSAIVDRATRGLEQVKSEGVQVVNMSFGIAEQPCSPSDPRILCSSLQAAADRDIVLVASAGNDRAGLELPANDADVIAVGGLEWTGVGADEEPTAGFWDESPQCPYAGEPGFDEDFECGSNFGPELDLAAPARSILSTAYTGFDQNTRTLCGDSFLAGGPGYGGCTGTSMSAAEVTAIIAAIRSIHPLLSRDDVYNILTSTASQAGNRTDQTGFGYPDMAAAVRVALGQVGGATLPNRLTPLFSFFGMADDQDPVTNPDFKLAETHVYTTVPSTASALLLDSDDPFRTLGPSVPGYPSFPQTQCVISPCDTLPAASIYVFTTEKTPFPGAPPLVPLYRLRYDPDGLADCDPDVGLVPERDYAYATTISGVLHFKNNVVDADGVGYDLDGIEGYLYESCESEPECTPPPETVRVYRMYHSERDDYAVFPETELAAMTAQGYQEQTGLASVLGYAYLNVDSDGDALIDGFESLIGTDPAAADSDCDGASDGAEIQTYDPALGSYGDPLLGPCSLVDIFLDGFESGDVSRWSSAAP